MILTNVSGQLSFIIDNANRNEKLVWKWSSLATRLSLSSLMTKTKSAAKNQRQRVTETIRDQILNGKLKPGEPLRQIPLSKEFGVAQTVIRESLQTLEQHGLVSAISNVGVFVREMGPEELLAAYQVREVLEGLAARLCCRTASRADIELLEAAAHEIYAAKGPAERSLRSELERNFHHRFLTLSRNETLIRQGAGYQFIGDMIVSDRNRDEILKEHLAIVKAIADNQPDDAEKFARQHVVTSAQSNRDHFEAKG